MIDFEMILLQAANGTSVEGGGLLDGILKSLLPFFFGRDGPNWIMPSVFIAAILIVFVGFGLYALIKFIRSKSKIIQLKKVLLQTSRDSIHSDFEEIRAQILKLEGFDL